MLHIIYDDRSLLTPAQQVELCRFLSVERVELHHSDEMVAPLPGHMLAVHWGRKDYLWRGGRLPRVSHWDFRIVQTGPDVVAPLLDGYGVPHPWTAWRNTVWAAYQEARKCL